MSDSVLVALRSELRDLLAKMSSDGTPTARDVVNEFRKANQNFERSVSLELENMALVKLVGGVADLRRATYGQNQGDLFSEYVIPRYVNIRRNGKNCKKRVSDVTIPDLEAILERYNNSLRKKPKRIEEFERLLSRMKESSATSDLTALQYVNMQHKP